VLYMRGDGSLFEVSVAKTAPSAVAPQPVAAPAAAPPAPPAEPIAAVTADAAAPAPAATPVQPPAPAAVAVAAPVLGASAATTAIPMPAPVPSGAFARLAARWKWLVGGAVAMFVLLAAIGLVMERAEQQAPVAQATAAIDQFHSYLGNKDYYYAWKMLTDDWQ